MLGNAASRLTQPTENVNFVSIANWNYMVRTCVKRETLTGITSMEVMMATNVTSKGQVTIPIEFRRALGITKGTAVDFEFDGNGLRLVSVKRRIFSRVEDGYGMLKYSGKTVALEEMDAAIAAGAQDSL